MNEEITTPEVTPEVTEETTVETPAEEVAEDTIDTADEVTPSSDEVVDEDKEAEIREGTLERENPIA